MLSNRELTTVTKANGFTDHRPINYFIVTSCIGFVLSIKQYRPTTRDIEDPA